MKLLACLILMLVTAVSSLAELSIPQKLQSATVLVATDEAQGTGVVFSNVSTNGQHYNFVWTAAHVISDAEHENGTFDRVTVTQITQEGDQMVSANTYYCSVIRNDPDLDVALLMVLKKDGFTASCATFDLSGQIPTLGMPVLHCGNLGGMPGYGSVTDGLISYVNRLYLFTYYDQVSCPIQSGSSGGGIYSKQDGKCLGFVLLKPSQSMGFILPIRQVLDWAKLHNALWALNPSIPVPADMKDHTPKPLVFPMLMPAK